MRAQWIRSGLMSAAALFGSVAWQSHDATAAEHLLYVQGSDSSGGNCSPSTSNQYYFVEGFGYGPFGNTVCQVSALGGGGSGNFAGNFTLGTCPSGLFGAVTHGGAITIRTVNSLGGGPYSLFSTLSAQGTHASWTSWSNQISYNAPAGSRCASGATFTAVTLGLDNP
jgi:hypothetical protein